MSYRLDLSDLDRERGSLRRQIVQRFIRAVDAGELPPEARVPSTRQIAAAAGVNHLTAVRAMRDLAASGYVYTVPRSGTFVRRSTPGAPPAGADWQFGVLPARNRLAEDHYDTRARSAVPGMVSLAVGWPARELRPGLALRRHAEVALAEHMGEITDYGDPAGAADLREAIAARSTATGAVRDAREVVVTNGASQGLHLVLRAVVEPGDVVAVESPTYAGVLDAVRSCGAQVLGIPVDSEGFQVDVLARALRRKEVKLCVLQPDHHNPTGVSTTASRRQQLAQLAETRGMFVLEDAAYADLGFTGEAGTSLRRLAPDHTIHVGTLSKSVAGGLRIGWASASGPALRRIAASKMASDYHTPVLTQLIAAGFLASGDYTEHLQSARSTYQRRAGILSDALELHMPGSCTYPAPSGGHHLWVTFTDPVDEETLYVECHRAGVLYTRPSDVLCTEQAATSIRLSFCHAPLDDLAEGAARLARALQNSRKA